MSFDPQSLYAKPEPGRSVRPIVFVAGGLAVVGTVLGIMTKPFWWPDTPAPTTLGQDIKTQNSGSPPPPLNFEKHYKPAVYSPPPPAAAPAEPVADEPSPFVPPPSTGPAVAGPPKKRGIPESERVSSLVLEGQQPAAPGAAGTASQPAGGRVQQVADRGNREGFYGAAGRSSDVFSPTGIVGQLGACSVRPGSFIFHEAAGVISSDTPGQITARTTRPIYAGPTGGCYAAPAGSTLVGTFNASTSYGEERLQVAWVGLFLPNGRMIDLGGMPGAGGDGAAGLPADVNNHYGALAGAVLAGTAVDVIRGLATFGGGGGGDDVVINMGQSLADRTASIGEKLVDRELSRRPTMTAKSGELTVQVTRPIELEPYRD